VLDFAKAMHNFTIDIFPLCHHQSLLLWVFGSITAAAIIDDSIAAKINPIADNATNLRQNRQFWRQNRLCFRKNEPKDFFVP
jgi:hypothetical protein